VQGCIEFIKASLQQNFVQESILVVMSVVFGGLITVIINNGAMKKQSKFEMQRKIIEELLHRAENLQKRLEQLEIGISFKLLCDDEYNAAANEVGRLCLSLNEALRKKRKFVLRYIKAVTVEESAKMAVQLQKALYEFGEAGFTDMKVKQTPDTEMIHALRILLVDSAALSTALTESLEKLSSPGIIAKLARLIRPARLFIGECYAIWRVGLKEKKKQERKHRW
jgi:hypothetical protein